MNQNYQQVYINKQNYSNQQYQQDYFTHQNQHQQDYYSHQNQYQQYYQSSSNSQYNNSYGHQQNYDDTYEKYNDSYGNEYEDNYLQSQYNNQNRGHMNYQQYYSEVVNSKMNNQPMPSFQENQDKIMNESKNKSPILSPFAPPQSSLPELPVQASSNSPSNGMTLDERNINNTENQRLQEQNKDIKNEAALESLKQSNHEHWKEVKQIYTMEIEEYKELEKHYGEREYSQDQNKINQNEMAYHDEPDDVSSYGSDAINDIISDLNNFNPADTINNPISYSQSPVNRSQNSINHTQHQMGYAQSPMSAAQQQTDYTRSPAHHTQSQESTQGSFTQSPVHRTQSPMNNIHMNSSSSIQNPLGQKPINTQFNDQIPLDSYQQQNVDEMQSVNQPEQKPIMDQQVNIQQDQINNLKQAEKTPPFDQQKQKNNVNEDDHYESSQGSFDINDFIVGSLQEGAGDEKEKYEFEDFQGKLEKSLGFDKEIFGDSFNNKHISLSLSLPNEQIDPFANDDLDAEYSRLMNQNISANNANNSNQELINNDLTNSKNHNDETEQKNEQQFSQQSQQSQRTSISSNENHDIRMKNGKIFYPEVVEESIIAGHEKNINPDEDSISSDANNFVNMIDEVMISGNKEIIFDDYYPITEEAKESKGTEEKIGNIPEDIVRDNSELIVDDVVENLSVSVEEGEAAQIEIDQSSKAEIVINNDSKEQYQTERPTEIQNQMNTEEQNKIQDEVKPEEKIEIQDEAKLKKSAEVQDQMKPKESEESEKPDELEKVEVQEKINQGQEYLNNLFPGLKENKSDNETQVNGLVPNSTEVDQKTLNEKLKELEEEKQQFIAGNERLKKMQTETEQLRLKFESDQAAFERYVTDEKQKIEEMKEEEKRRIKRDQLINEKKKREEELLPSVQDKQEIKALKEEIERLMNEAKEKESKYNLTVDRLKKQIDDLTQKNTELQEEIKVLEKERAMNLKINKESERNIPPPPDKERVKSMFQGERGLHKVGSKERVKSMHPGMELRDVRGERVKSMHPGMELRDGRDSRGERIKSMHPGMEIRDLREQREGKERVKSMYSGINKNEPKDRVKSMHPGLHKISSKDRIKSIHPGMEGIDGRDIRVKSMHLVRKPSNENNISIKVNKLELTVDPKSSLSVDNQNNIQGKSPISKTALSNRVTTLDGNAVPRRKSSVIPPLNRQLMRQSVSPGSINSGSTSNTSNTPNTPNYGNHLIAGNANNATNSEKHNINEVKTPQLNEIKKVNNHTHLKQPTKNGSLDSLSGIQMRRVTTTNIASPIMKGDSSPVTRNTNVNVPKNGSVSSSSSLNSQNKITIDSNNPNMSPITSKNSIESPVAPPVTLSNVPKTQNRKIPVGLPQNIPPGVNIFTAMERELNLPPPVDEIKIDEGKFKRIYPNGTTLISFKNGTIKEINSEGTSIIRFPNGDIKQVLSNKEIIYFYHETKAIQTTHTNGIEVFEFPNGQIETKYPDSSIEIRFPDKTIRRIFANGEEENVYANGIKMRTTKDGKRLVDYPDGSKEIYTDSFRKLIKNDGTVKIVHADGRRETQLPNGHIIIKDSKGNIISETN
jgi:hypothetical protein